MFRTVKTDQKTKAASLLRRITKHTAYGLVIALLGLVLLGGALAWRLSLGPVSVGFLTPYVEQALTTADKSFRVSVEDTVVTWAGWERNIDIRAIRVSAHVAGEGVVATAPEVAVSFSARALLRGLIAPVSVEIIGVRVRLTRDEGGQFGMGFDDATPTSESAASGTLGARLLRGLLAVPDQDRRLGYLKRFSVIGAQTRLDDKRMGVSWHATHADIGLERDARGILLEISADLDSGGKVARIGTEALYDSTTRGVTGSVRFEDLLPSHLASDGGGSALEGLAVPLAGRVGFDMDADGEIHMASFSIEGGAGELAAAEMWKTPLPVRAVEITGRYDGRSRRITVENASIDLDGPNISFAGAADLRPENLMISLIANLGNLPVDALNSYWPRELATGARSWMSANLEDGAITNADITVEVDIPRDGFGFDYQNLNVGVARGSIDFAGVTTHYLKPLDPVLGVAGRGVFSDKGIEITLASGRLKDMVVSGGTLAFAALESNRPLGDFEIILHGPLASALAVLNHPRLGYAKRLGFDPALVEGQSALRLAVKLPLLANIRMKELQVGAAARLSDVKIPDVVGKAALTGGALTLQLDNTGMEVTGGAKLADIPVNLHWQEWFGAGSSLDRRYRIDADLTEEHRSRLGVDLASYMSGPLGMSVILHQRKDEGLRGILNANLTRTDLAIPELAWAKPVGEPARAAAELAFSDGVLRQISGIRVVAPDLAIEGKATLSTDGMLASVEVGTLSVGRSRLSANLLRRADGGFDVDIKGPAFDASGLLGDDRDASAGALPPVTISARFEQLWLGSGDPIEGVVGAMKFDGTVWENVVLRGRTGKARAVAFIIGREKNQRKLRVEAQDAGAFLRSLGVFGDAKGGSLLLTAGQAAGENVQKGTLPDTPWEGSLRIVDYYVKDTPVLAKILTVVSVTGIADLFSGGDIRFARFRAPFSIHQRKITIKDARAVGSEIGITGEGVIDLANDEVQLKGTVIPAYTINSLIGSIPFLGKLLTGTDGGGIFAMSYQVTGPVADPKVKSNPLTAFAPGFLRGFIDGLLGSASDSKEWPVVPEGG